MGAAVVVEAVAAPGRPSSDGDGRHQVLRLGVSEALDLWALRQSHLVVCGSACARLALPQCCSPGYRQYIGRVSYGRGF